MTPGPEKNKIKEKIRMMKEEIDNLEKESKSSVVFRNIEQLPKQIPIWMCGFTKHGEFDKVRSIPGQTFEGDRYVKSVAGMKNSDTDWQDFVNRL